MDVALNVRTILSSLWVYVLLNTLFRDVHELFRPGMVAELADGHVRGEPIDDTSVFFGGLTLQVPLALVVGSLVLPVRLARLANLVAAATTVGVVATTWPKDADDLLFAAFQLTGLAAVIALAWTWRKPTGPTTRSR